MAFRLRHSEIVERLPTAKTDKNVRVNYDSGQTNLQEVTRAGNWKVIERFLT